MKNWQLDGENMTEHEGDGTTRQANLSDLAPLEIAKQMLESQYEMMKKGIWSDQKDIDKLSEIMSFSYSKLKEEEKKKWDEFQKEYHRKSNIQPTSDLPPLDVAKQMLESQYEMMKKDIWSDQKDIDKLSGLMSIYYSKLKEEEKKKWDEFQKKYHGENTIRPASEFK